MYIISYSAVHGSIQLCVGASSGSVRQARQAGTAGSSGRRAARCLRYGRGCLRYGRAGMREAGMAVRFGYKASAEQFGPRELLELSVLAEDLGFDIIAVSDHFQPWRHQTGHAPTGPPLARRPRPGHKERHPRHQRAHADAPLSSLGRRSGLRHPRLPQPRTGVPWRRHGRVHERDSGDRPAMARSQGAPRAAGRGHRIDQGAMGVRSRHVRWPVLPDRRGDDI